MEMRGRSPLSDMLRKPFIKHSEGTGIEMHHIDMGMQFSLDVAATAAWGTQERCSDPFIDDVHVENATVHRAMKGMALEC